MKSFLSVLIVVTLMAGLVVSGCKREAEEPAKTSETAVSDTEVKTPEEVAEKAKQAAQVLAAASQGADTADAPAYLHTIARHIKGISQVLKENSGDCAKSVAALNKYLEDNKADIDTMRKAAEEDRDKLSDAEKMKLAQQAAALLTPVMQEFGIAQAAFAQSCPKELHNIAEAIKAFQTKPD
jgi:Na+-transporting methylmalonyl-CoA/oxaloacetate decarboxylase gamma subunit